MRSLIVLLSSGLLLALLPHSCSAVSAKLSVSPGTFAIGTKHTATCTVDGFDPTKVLLYGVEFDLASTNSAIGTVALGAYAAGLGSGAAFTPNPNITESNGGLVITQGDATAYPSFSIVFEPKSDSARGKYTCTLAVQTDLTNSQKATSNQWNASFGVTPSVVTLALSMVVLLLGAKLH